MDEDGLEVVEQRDYQCLVGSMMWGMLGTRPDLAFSICLVSQYNARPNTIHEMVAKRSLRYLSRTQSLGLVFDGKQGINMVGYVDAGFANLEGRRSVSGWIFLMAGGAVAWGARKQSTVAISNTEAEYIAILSALQELLWINTFMKELGRDHFIYNTILEDNHGALDLANSGQYRARTKHIDIKYHKIRECIEIGQLFLEYVQSGENLADALTKPLSKGQHWKFLRKMGLHDLPDH